MLKRQHKVILVISILFFLATQVLIFASIPKGFENEKINVVIKSGMGLTDIADLLKKQGIIESKYLFLFMSLFYGGKLIAGEYELNRNMSTMDIVKKMGNGERKIYIIKIIEGYNIYNVADVFDRLGLIKAHEFIELAKHENLLKRLNITGDSIEGYLYPDTYFYSKEIDLDKFIELIVKKMLHIFDREDMRKRMEELNLDVHKVLTLASMIEKEAKIKDEKPLISAVFHNRLKKGMPLDCDPTVIYGSGRFNLPITKKDLLEHTPYNTYKIKGLPKGPICNPDLTSIMAVLNPAPVNYLYFVSKNDGTHVFSEDMRTHNKYVILYQRAKNKKNHL
ncbi:MAG: endolytic transglycosylase MltG [Syntrophorhabdaceae bacterium]|nr:endolytic transglycosylase MltG [Syntrophorhabdaceae bacterium]